MGPYVVSFACQACHKLHEEGMMEDGSTKVPALAPVAAAYDPAKFKRLLRTGRDGSRSPRLGVTEPFDPKQGYANNFLLPTPSMMEGMLRTAGFELESWHYWPADAFRYVFVARPVDGAFKPG